MTRIKNPCTHSVQGIFYGDCFKGGKSSLFDDLECLAVSEYRDEDQEDDAFDELQFLRGQAYHREAAVEDVVEQRADDDVAEPDFRAAGNRHAAEDERDQDLRFELVADVRRRGAVLDDVDEGRKAGQSARERVDEELHAVRRGESARCR